MVSEKERELLRRVWNESLMKQLAHVRSRRFGLGYRYDTGEAIRKGNLVVEYPKGLLEFKSQKKPIPLSDVESALITWAAAGPNGLILADLGVNNNVATFIYATGRTIPGPDNDQGLDLIYVIDDGVYFYRPPQASKIYEIESEEDLGKIVNWHKNYSIKLANGRTDLAGTLPFAMVFNKNFNENGSTLLLPIYDASRVIVNILFHYFEYERVPIIDDNTGQLADQNGAMKRLVDKGILSSQIPMTMDLLDRAIGAVAGVVVGTSVQNVRLMSEAIGLGSWIFGGIYDYTMMGAFAPQFKGLEEAGAVVCQPPEKSKRIWPYKVGIKNVKMSFSIIEGCKDSPHKNGRELVEDFLNIKYGKYKEPNNLEYDGIWSPNRDPNLVAWKRDIYEMLRRDEKIKAKEDIKEAVISFIDYSVAKYGMFPRVDPIWIPMAVQVHHLDIDFYKKYYKEEVLTENILRHFEIWH
ncbi:hypothetical protein [Saccharolobus islandicus]|uniref:hypothetical protein n=1 Tax=Saccharolobus islandicus TaxID=43080 RepID=UPI0003619237|nr:hypothetical protein [Sulfolobus islandicus]